VGTTSPIDFVSSQIPAGQWPLALVIAHFDGELGNESGSQLEYVCIRLKGGGRTFNLTFEVV
jgi:hypothetical protein